MIFPAQKGATRLVMDFESATARLPVVYAVADDDAGLIVHDQRPGVPLLIEHSTGYLGRPGLRGHRLGGSADGELQLIAGRDWSTVFVPTALRNTCDQLAIDAVDEDAGLALRTEIQVVAGGSVRVRHILTNIGHAPYLIDGLEVTVPIADSFVELIDFTGRHMGERTPQRHAIADGLWLRESRGGRPGLDSATMLIAAEPGLSFGRGSALAVSVASSSNSALFAQRLGSWPAAIGGGELLLPGEITLTEGESYASPWVYIVAANDGLDGIAARLHEWQRTLRAHPDVQPVTFNAWEAVYFKHDPAVLLRLVDRAAQVGAERFVLDDGWFRGRRSDKSGLGDWFVDETVWPHGLTPLIDRVRGAGMEFGLWIEPEMVNPDSDLYRAHPDWILAAGPRAPILARNQLVLDLTNPRVWDYLYERLDGLLATYAIGYIKWDHNRDLVEAGSSTHGGVPVAHLQSAAYLRLLEAMRDNHPAVAFESCASGGGRIDLSVIEHIQRVWTSDQTDALARQRIQRWTTQLVAPEYLGAHVSSPTSHHTGRTLSLDFRAATALFGAFGIEWDLTQASSDELRRLAEWARFYKEWRPVLHTGRVVRCDVADAAVIAHGVVAADGRSALFAHVQMDESIHNRGVILRSDALDPMTQFHCRWALPDGTPQAEGSLALLPVGPTGGNPITGAELGRVGIWFPRQRPETIRLFVLHAAGSASTA